MKEVNKLPQFKKLSNLQIVSDKFKNIKYEVDTDIVGQKDLKPFVKINVQDPEYIKEQDHYIGILGLIIKFQLKKGKRALLKFDATLEGEFWGNIQLPEEKFKELVEKSGIIHLLMIARSKILAMSSLFGFNRPIYIPLMDIRGLVNNKLKKPKEVKK